jgi:selenocysteine-specific elongation factor
MIIGTAGHIDHGKTALVRALTGVDADRLPEEKRRGMTIDLGFAYRAVPAAGKAGERVLGFVDVPGHERFVHNMLAGATGIDFVLLVVAADDGPMPQTREHLEIVSLLGVERGVVALTKIDRVSPERRAEATGEVGDLLAGSPLREAEIMPVSSVTGEGVAALAAHLTSAAKAVGVREPRGEFRLAVDRSFVLPGIGVVVTGTVAAGGIAVGERAVVTPSGVTVRIRGIHVNNRPARVGHAGERCALQLSGAPGERDRIRRGDWVVAPTLHAPTDRFDAGLRLVRPHPRMSHAGVSVHLHLGAARVGVRLMPLADRPLPGGEAPAQLVLEHAIGAWRGDRFILRDAAARHTIGGGVVLDPRPPARGRRAPERLAELAALARPHPAAALAELLSLSRAGVDLDRFALAAGLTPAEAQALWREAGAHVLKAEQQRHGFAFSPERFAALRRDIAKMLAAHHRAMPASPGLEFDRLRLMLSKRLPPPVLRALVKMLVEEGALVLRGAAVGLPGHEAALPPAEARLWPKICRRLDERGFDPPWVRDLADELALPETATRQLMKRLAHIGELVEVAPDRFYRRAKVHEMAALLAEMCADAADGTVTAAAFRDRIGTGRKLAIIILEFFDRSGITLRRGDLRNIRRERLQTFAPPHP